MSEHRGFRSRTPTLICRFKVSAVQRKWVFPYYSRHWKRMCPIYWWQRSTTNLSRMCIDTVTHECMLAVLDVRVHKPGVRQCKGKQLTSCFFLILFSVSSTSISATCSLVNLSAS